LKGRVKKHVFLFLTFPTFPLSLSHLSITSVRVSVI
jgi:hypothetical protein